MTDKAEMLVKLPTLQGRENNLKLASETAELAELLQKTIAAWAIARKDKPMAFSIGAACYAAMWSVSEGASPENRAAMREACRVTLLKNDETAGLLLIAAPPTPPN